MARSKYIYIALDRDGAPIAAFTVKYELAGWLRGMTGTEKTASVIRFHDGVGSSAGQLVDLEAARAFQW